MLHVFKIIPTDPLSNPDPPGYVVAESYIGALDEWSKWHSGRAFAKQRPLAIKMNKNAKLTIHHELVDNQTERCIDWCRINGPGLLKIEEES